MKSFSVLALCVPLARLPNATHNAVSIALFPPTPIKKAMHEQQIVHLKPHCGKDDKSKPT